MTITELDSDAFRTLVEDEVHYQGDVVPDEYRQLRTPEHARRWYETLVQLNHEVEAHLTEINAQLRTEKDRHVKMGPAGKQTWFTLEANLQDRRRSAVRKKGRIEVRMAEARQFLRSITKGGDPANQITQLKEQIELAEKLIDAWEYETFMAGEDDFSNAVRAAFTAYRTKYPRRS